MLELAEVFFGVLTEERKKKKDEKAEEKCGFIV
jgi:hypothetical protein